jgi:hypothetical protein
VIAPPDDFPIRLGYSDNVVDGEKRVSATEDTIIEFFRDQAIAAWKDEQPYLLSFAGPDLTEKGIDYRTILEGEKLKAFVERTEGSGRYRVVKHPHQKAKIGLVKYGEKFEFSSNDHDDALLHDVQSPKTQHSSALFEFLDALSKLPVEDLDGIVIPTRVLVKLSKKR